MGEQGDHYSSCNNIYTRGETENITGKGRALTGTRDLADVQVILFVTKNYPATPAACVRLWRWVDSPRANFVVNRWAKVENAAVGSLPAWIACARTALTEAIKTAVHVGSAAVRTFNPSCSRYHYQRQRQCRPCIIISL